MSKTNHIAWDLEHSEFGEGRIEAEVTSDANGAVFRLVNVRLRWCGLHEQPEVWEIEWSHHPDYILDELPAYLRRCCPVPNEMIQALRELRLETFPTLDDSEEESPKPKQPARPPSMSRATGKAAESLLARLATAQKQPEEGKV